MDENGDTITGLRYKKGIFIIGILVLGSLPFIRDDYRYFFNFCGENPNKYVAGLLGVGIIWPCTITAVIWGTWFQKSWTLTLALCVFSVSICEFLNHIIIFGTYGQGIEIIMSCIVFTIFLFLIKNPEIRSLFHSTENQLKTQKILVWIILIGIIAWSVFFYFVLLPKSNQYSGAFYTPIKMNLEKSEKNFKESEYSPEKAFGWEFLIPKSVNIKFDDYKENGIGKSLAFRDKNDKILILIHEKNWILDNGWSDLGLFIRLNSDYEIIKKIWYEKYGFVFLSMKAIVWPKNAKVYEFYSKSLQGFMTKVEGKDKNQIVYDYLLFDRDGHHVAMTFLVDPDQITENTINQLVARVARINT